MTEKSNGAVDKDAISQRLEEIYKRLEFIDAYSAEARAASILAVSSIFVCHSSFEVCSCLKLGFKYGTLPHKLIGNFGAAFYPIFEVHTSKKL